MTHERLPKTLFVVLLLASLAGCREEQLAIGQPAPALAATDPAGEPTSLDAWRGRPVFLAFWSNTCGSCIAEMKQLETLAHTHANRVTVVAVNVDAAPPNLPDIRRRHGFSFPLLQDSLGISRERYEVVGTPTTVLIGADGRVLAHHVGAQAPEQLATAFATLTASLRTPTSPAVNRKGPV